MEELDLRCIVCFGGWMEVVGSSLMVGASDWAGEGDDNAVTAGGI
jgi:hypothetical protein